MKYQIPAGVLTGDQVQEVFALAKEKGFALPAVNVIGSNSINTIGKLDNHWTVELSGSF